MSEAIDCRNLRLLGTGVPQSTVCTVAICTEAIASTGQPHRLATSAGLDGPVTDRRSSSSSAAIITRAGWVRRVLVTKTLPASLPSLSQKTAVIQWPWQRPVAAMTVSLAMVGRVSRSVRVFQLTAILVR